MILSNLNKQINNNITYKFNHEMLDLIALMPIEGTTHVKLSLALLNYYIFNVIVQQVNEDDKFWDFETLLQEAYIHQCMQK